MKRSILLSLPLALPALLAMAGCTDEFVSEEMLLGAEPKLRPLAVVCEPAEVSPGQWVDLEFTYWDPHPDRTVIDWKVALDYDEGLYGSAPIERNYVDLSVGGVVDEPRPDGNGMMVQHVGWLVPDDVLRNASALPAVLDQEPWRSLTGAVAPGRILTRQETDEALAAIHPFDLFEMGQEQATAVWNLADLFGCRVRFRAELRGGIALDVTRNLTVRHSRRLNSRNTNSNIELAWFNLLVVEAPDVEFGELAAYADRTTTHALRSYESDFNLDILAREDWTYFVSAEFVAQRYTSPFSGEELFSETGRYRWYSFRQDDGDRGYPLIRGEDGDEAEMWELDEWVRIVPPVGGESRFRVFVCVRDERPEWTGSNWSSGVALQGANLHFVPE